jgi:caa(3)-type oxidase subunit IV
MTDTVHEDTTEQAGHAAPAHAAHAHPTPKDYWIIFVVLVVVTAVEVAIVYTDAPRGIIVAVLASAAIFKFALVVMWYMHLRFERPLFRRFFLIGLVGALVLYGVVLATFSAFA